MKRAPVAPLGMSSFCSWVRGSTSFARLDRRFFQIGSAFRGVRFNQADVVEEKLVAARGAELAFFEKHADFRRGAVGIVGEGLDHDRNFVRRVALEGDVFQRAFVPARARALGDGPLDGVLRHAFLARLLQRRGQPRIGCRIGAPVPRGNGDFTDEFARRLRLSQRGDLAFGQ